MKIFINFLIPPLILGSVVIGFIFETEIQQHIREYSAVMHCCATIFFTGLIYSLVTRSLIVLSVTTAATIATPWIKEWLFFYWPYNPFF